METFVMVCREFGGKFKFTAVNHAEANSKAKKYCRYHSMPDQFYAIPENFDNSSNLQLHNECVS